MGLTQRMKNTFRKATPADADAIWKILQQAILRRKSDGSNQWQDGYPNPDVINRDIEKGYGYVLTLHDEIIGYAAVLFNDEPAYEAIEGKWLSTGDFTVVHRIAISNACLGQGLSAVILQFIEQLSIENGISSVKVDTNFDNPAMLRIFEKLGYTYCGQVYFRGSPRKAFEKLLR